MDRLAIPSSTATDGVSSSISRARMARWVSSPNADGRAAQMRSKPASTHGRRSSPSERILRSTCSGDSSSKTISACSPRSQAEFTTCAPSEVLPVPAVPLTMRVDPRNMPPPSMWSRRAMPVEIRSSEAP